VPLYDYECLKCNTRFERMKKMNAMDEPLSEPCPECEAVGHIEQSITSAALGDPIRLGVKRPDSGWGDVLSKVKAAHPNGHWSDKKYIPSSGR